MNPDQELILHIDPGSATIKVESRSPEGSIAPIPSLPDRKICCIMERERGNVYIKNQVNEQLTPQNKAFPRIS